MIVTMTAAFFCAPMAAFLGKAGVKSCSEGKEQISFWQLWAVAQACSLFAIAMTYAGAEVMQSLLAAILLALLAAGAAVDRQTAWAPDHLILPICVLSAMYGSASGAWDFELWLAALLGAAVYLTVQGLWIICAIFTDTANNLPPADILALIVPAMALGFTTNFVICMLLISSVLAIVILIPNFESILSKKDVAKAVRSEMGRSEDTGPVVTFLTVGLPAAGLVIVASVFV